MKKNHIAIILLVTLFLFSCGGYKYSEKKIKDISSSGIKTLQILNKSGELDIKGISGYGKIRVIATIRMKTDDRKEARELIKDKVDIQLTKKGNRAVLESRYRNLFLLFWQGARIDHEIYVPRNMKLVVKDRGKKVFIENISNTIEVNDLFGDVALYNINAAITIKDLFGKISIKRTRGKIDIKDRSGIIDIENTVGNIRIKDASGLIELDNITGNIDIDDGMGHIHATNIYGNLLIPHAGLGKIKLRKIRGNIIQN